MDITSSLIKVEATEAEAVEEATIDIVSNCKVLTIFRKVKKSIMKTKNQSIFVQVIWFRQKNSNLTKT